MKKVGRPWPPRLDVEKVKKIRRLRESGESYKNIAERFEIAVSTVWKITHGEIWKEEKLKE